MIGKRNPIKNANAQDLFVLLDQGQLQSTLRDLAVDIKNNDQSTPEGRKIYAEKTKRASLLSDLSYHFNLQVGPMLESARKASEKKTKALFSQYINHVSQTTGDIVFDNVNAYRRYLGSGKIFIYRSIVQLRIGGENTAFYNDSGSLPLDYGIGCISIFSPFQDQYGGTSFPPYGNDPLSLLISNVEVGEKGNNYITATDDFPWDISEIAAPSAGNPFSVNAHNILDLGGFIINLEGLSGYIN